MQQPILPQPPMQQPPMQQSPMQQSPMQQSPMQQSPMQQSPMQQSPMQQSPMQQFDSVEAVRAWSRQHRAEGACVGFVPTMGALHAGHLSLVEAARAAGADRVVVSIFVNPTQFEPGEDLDAYPRDIEGDLARLRSVGVDAVFLPSVETIYPPGSRTRVLVEQLSEPLCGISRPNHFGGVATVVTLLFNIVQPDLAVFGEKDFQQLQVIRRLTADLHLPVRIVGGPIVREADGLAMSSRNAYLDAEERQRATALSAAIREARQLVAAGERRVTPVIAAITARCAPAGVIDYIEILNEETLEPVQTIGPGARVFLAVQVGRARLIDNGTLWSGSTQGDPLPGG